MIDVFKTILTKGIKKIMSYKLSKRKALAPPAKRPAKKQPHERTMESFDIFPGDMIIDLKNTDNVWYIKSFPLPGRAINKSLRMADVIRYSGWVVETIYINSKTGATEQELFALDELKRRKKTTTDSTGKAIKRKIRDFKLVRMPRATSEETSQ